MRNRDRMVEDKDRLEDELNNVKNSHSNVLKIYQITVNDQIKEMMRLEQRRDLTTVRIYYHLFIIEFYFTQRTQNLEKTV